MSDESESDREGELTKTENQIERTRPFRKTNEAEAEGIDNGIKEREKQMTSLYSELFEPLDDSSESEVDEEEQLPLIYDRQMTNLFFEDKEY